MARLKYLAPGSRSAAGSRALLVLAAWLVVGAAAADTLAEVRERGYLRCGIQEGAPGFSTIDERGERVGFDIDHCKTIAAAVFGELKIEYIPITPHTVFTLLQTGGLDIYPGSATWSFSRDVGIGVDYAGVYFYAGQSVVVRRSAGVTSLVDLDGATICVGQGTTNERNVADYFGLRGLRYIALTFADEDKGLQAYRVDRCDAFSTGRVSIAGRIANWPDRNEHVILSDLIVREPLGPVVRQDDPRWRDIAFWAFNAQIAAEELGVSQANVDEMRASSSNPDVRRMLGVDADLGAALGLERDWAYWIIKLVGNYGDTWDRHFTPLGLDRGINANWRDGGLHVAMPFR